MSIDVMWTTSYYCFGISRHWKGRATPSISPPLGSILLIEILIECIAFSVGRLVCNLFIRQTNVFSSPRAVLVVVTARFPYKVLISPNSHPLLSTTRVPRCTSPVCQLHWCCLSHASIQSPTWSRSQSAFCDRPSDTWERYFSFAAVSYG